MTTTATNLLSLANTGAELIEALEYLALDESQGWEALLDETNNG
jgi:hypothetical protein